MKRIYDLLLLVCMTVAFSCTRKDVDATVYTTIEAALPEVMTSKVSLSERSDDTGLNLSWEQTDVLTVAGEGIESFQLASSDGSKATFTGKKVSGTVFDITLSTGGSSLERSYLIQEQSGVSSSSGLGYSACLKGVDTYHKVEFTQEWAQTHGGMLMQSGCLLLSFRLPFEVSEITKVVLESSEPVFYADDSDTSPKAAKVEVSIKDGIPGIDNTVRIYMMTSMNESVIPEKTLMRLTVVTSRATYHKEFVTDEVPLRPGKRNVLKINSGNWKPVMEYKDLTVMTYNVGRFCKYKTQLGHYSYPETAAVMKHYSIDVVGLNETVVSQSGLVGENQPEALAAEMGTEWTYCFAGAKDESYGNSIVSSPDYAILGTYRVILPATASTPNPDGNYETRSLCVAEYEDFVFCVTHLDHNNKANRMAQIEIIDKWVQTVYSDSDKLIVLVGDMNAVPDAPEISTGLGVCWTPVSDLLKPTYADKCIDYIFVLKNAAEYVVNEADVIVGCPNVELSLVSDHYPVYAALTFIKRYE